jgi:hypothetical protein
VVSRIVGSWRTKTTLVTRRGFSARNRPPAAAQARDGANSRKRRKAIATEDACTSDWKTAADRGEEVPVRRNQPPSSNEKRGGR